MILTCPECATSYFVDDLRIPRGGRMVKCTTCGNRWRAFQDRSLPEREEPEEEMLVEGPRTPPPEDDLEFVAAPVTPVRKSEPAKKKSSPALVATMGVVAALAVAAGAAVIFRQQVVGLIPASAPVFAAIGLPVNTLGLVMDAKLQAGFQAGKPVLSVTGSIRNVNKVPTEAPPIRIGLLDRNGKVLAGMLAQPLNAKIPPGAIRYFAISLPDPPSGAHDVDIAFEPQAKGKAAAGKGHAAPAEAHAAPAEHAPPPVEAQPLPADSPDALKKHEQH